LNYDNTRKQDVAVILSLKTLVYNSVNINLIWTIISLYFAFVIYISSPGYVTMDSNDSLNVQYTRSLQNWSRLYPFRASSLKTFIEKVCNICKTGRPLRSKHCYVCGRCVYKFDHHCSLLSTCIGLKTYRDYAGFILSQFLWYCLSLFDLRGIIYLPSLYKEEKGGYHLLLYLWLMVLLSLFLFFGQLMVYHSRLIYLNATTNEDCRMIYGQRVYPYNAGFSKNWKSFKNKSFF